MRETIFALSSGFGTSAVAVFRLSGPASFEVISSLTRQPLPLPRVASVRTLRDRDDQPLDQALVLVFEAGASFTGEESAEIQCHGGRAVVQRLSDELAAQPSCRMAEPGEFTRRAFENGRMDLAMIEGLGDLISADTEHQRRQAMRLMTGGLSNVAEEWRETLLECRTLLEVTIDWVDEDVPEDVMPEVARKLGGLRDALRHELRQGARTERLRTGFQVALIGPPNAGKSSLLNAIAGREAALISDIPGTTRDVLEVPYDLNGLPVIFLDTAGLRTATDAIEKLGIDRARDRATGADLRIHLRSFDTGTSEYVIEGIGATDISVWSKSDIGTGEADILLSSVTGEGVENLLQLVQTRLEAQAQGAGLLGHARQQQAVAHAMERIEHCLQRLYVDDLELCADALREASAALERLVGRIDVEDVLESVFSAFCLGK